MVRGVQGSGDAGGRCTMCSWTLVITQLVGSLGAWYDTLDAIMFDEKAFRWAEGRHRKS